MKIGNIMINKIKKVVKSIIKWDYLTNPGSYDQANFPDSLKRFVHNNPEFLIDGRSVGKRSNDKPFTESINVKAYNFFSYEVHEFGNDSIKDLSEYCNFNSGTPLRAKPFSLCIKEVKKTIRKRNLYLYPSNTGDVRSKKKFLEYLLKEGFKLKACPGYDGLSMDNIAFTCSTSQAYMMIIKTIAKENDVILITGPNYGLFAIESERYCANVEILNLSEEDDWYVNPKKLASKIDEINLRLKNEFSNNNDGYIPRVVAFLNMNPHNPLGKVMSKKNLSILHAIGDVCLEKGVFIIDDLIYRDLTFDRDNLAYPIAMDPKYFNNTISLFGISKAFALASFRAGVIVAPKVICQAINDMMYQHMVSMPVLQVASVVGAFNGSNRRYKYYNSYFKKIINEYKYRYDLFSALVEGINTIDESSIRNKIYKDVYKNVRDKELTKELLKGIPDVCVRKKTIPESGFFAVMDFTLVKGKKYGDIVINNDLDLLRYLYQRGKIKYIMGQSMNWPNDELIARINFCLEKRDLVHNLYVINKAIKDLK